MAIQYHLLAITVSVMIFALIAPEFACVTGSKSSTAEVAVSLATARGLGAAPPVATGHASCIAHIAVTNKPARTSSSSALLDLLTTQAKEIKLHYSTAFLGVTSAPLLKPDKWLSTRSPDRSLSQALVCVKSTVLLI